jgi:hypothetical protein
VRVEDQLRHFARATEDRQVPVSLSEVTDGDFPGGGAVVERDGRSSSAWLAMVAATVLVLAGIGGLVWWAGNDPVPVGPVDTAVPGTTAPSTSTTAPPTTIAASGPVEMTPTLDYRPDGAWFIPDVIPDGFEFRYAVRQDVLDMANVQDIYYALADCSLSGGCPELSVGLLTDIDAASLGGPESRWEEVDGAEDVFTTAGLGSREVIRRDGNAVAWIGGGNLSFEELVEVARSTRLRPESELPRPPFICCRTLVEEEGNPGPVVAQFTLGTDDGEKTYSRNAHTDGRFILPGGDGTGYGPFGSAYDTPIDPPVSLSSRPGRYVLPALPSGYDLVAGITSRDVAAVELELGDGRTITIPTQDLSGRFDARFIFAPVEVDENARSSPTTSIGIRSITALDAAGNIIGSP